ncbi:C4-dicarboxylate ABC transporter substrate-binding protein [Pseudooceanicola sp. 216_PA32_1]|uniref:C4-dicarboxylate ABC transporter substrate-binding protein n=1 Tax=Pseudooceanicola pacificus TaxID=2676438 RepID=A0A844W2K9_9RHOB|nr:TRAP transporter substrate-binding protein [Pseudooceanicola pacificus]MWB78017.1 C4-dicarboxylate ABC transporter substrate-binding protein [Pseudooceanicola pacificus]
MHFNRTLTAALAVSAALLTGAAPAAAQSVSLAYDTPPSYDVQPSYRWAKNFTDKLAEAGFEVETFANNSIGGEAERFDQMRSGLLNVDMGGYAFGIQLVPEMEVIRLPFVFDSMEHLSNYLKTSGFIDEMNEKMKGSGVHVLAIIPLTGFAGFFNNKKPIATLADFDGIRMRALDASQLKLIEAIGANGVVIPFSEVPAALQTGVADGYINPVNVPLTFGHGDLLKYYTDSGMFVSVRLAMASESWWDGLSDQDKAKVDAAVAYADNDLMTWTTGAVEVEKQKLRDAGFEVTELSPDARAEFVAATASVVDQLDIPNKDVYLQAIEAAKP